VLRNLEDTTPELRELRNSNVAALADAAGAKALNLVGVAAVIISALFFLTVAQVSRGRLKVRQVFFAAGGLLVLVGTLLFLIVEFVA